MTPRTSTQPSRATSDVVERPQSEAPDTCLRDLCSIRSRASMVHRETKIHYLPALLAFLSHISPFISILLLSTHGMLLFCTNSSPFVRHPFSHSAWKYFFSLAPFSDWLFLLLTTFFKFIHVYIFSCFFRLNIQVWLCLFSQWCTFASRWMLLVQLEAFFVERKI